MVRATTAPLSTPSVKTYIQASMTTLAPRPPLQQLDNIHMMSERGNGRRTSARLADKDDASTTNGCNIDQVKKSHDSIEGKQTKVNAGGVGTKPGAKRKPSKYDPS